MGVNERRGGTNRERNEEADLQRDDDSMWTTELRKHIADLYTGCLGKDLKMPECSRDYKVALFTMQIDLVHKDFVELYRYPEGKGSSRKSSRIC